MLSHTILASAEALVPLFQVLVPLLLIVVAFITGSTIERRHFRSLARREQQFAHVLITDLKSFPGTPVPGSQLVCGQTVIACDYLKKFLAGLRKLLGGELRSYDSLMERARREAIARMVEEAVAQGYDAVCNIRVNFSSIGGTTPQAAPMVEVLVSGTAYRRHEEEALQQ